MKRRCIYLSTHPPTHPPTYHTGPPPNHSWHSCPSTHLRRSVHPPTHPPTHPPPSTHLPTHLLNTGGKDDLAVQHGATLPSSPIHPPPSTHPPTHLLTTGGKDDLAVQHGATLLYQTADEETKAFMHGLRDRLSLALNALLPAIVGEESPLHRDVKILKTWCKVRHHPPTHPPTHPPIYIRNGVS